MASQGAPNKAALDYFPKMVNFYEDDKIFDLLDEYGPTGGYYIRLYFDDCILKWLFHKSIKRQAIENGHPEDRK